MISTVAVKRSFSRGSWASIFTVMSKTLILERPSVGFCFSLADAPIR